MDDSLQHQFAEIEAAHWWFQGRRRVLASVISRYLADEGGGRAPRIFDVGCGTGEMVDMLRGFGAVSAIDSSPEAVRHCRERFAGAVSVAVGQVPDDLPPPGTADMVTAFDVLEHLDDDLGALRAIHLVLPEDGILVVTVPALQMLWGPHDVLSHHRRRYRRPQLRRVLEEAGFSIERLSYFNTWLFPMAATVRLLRRLRDRGRPPTPASDFTMPSPLVNRLLEEVFASEATVLRLGPLPIGVSILAVCRKPSGAAGVGPAGGQARASQA